MYKMFSFHPGETFVLNFVIPFSTFDVKAVVLSFRDQDRVAYETMAASCVSVDQEHVRVGYLFSQAESLMFDEDKTYMMQLNVFGPNGSRATSSEMKVQTLKQQILEPGFTTDPIVNVNYSGSGSVINGGSGSSAVDYNDLVNKPRINDITLAGNRILPEQRITESQIDAITNQGGES